MILIFLESLRIHRFQFGLVSIVLHQCGFLANWVPSRSNVHFAQCSHPLSLQKKILDVLPIVDDHSAQFYPWNSATFFTEPSFKKMVTMESVFSGKVLKRRPQPGKTNESKPDEVRISIYIFLLRNIRGRLIPIYHGHIGC